MVANICVYAAPDKSKPVAIIYPAEPALKKLAAENGVAGGDLGTLVHNRKLNAAVLKELQAAGRRGGLSGIEIIEGVVMADEEWTPQNVSMNSYIFASRLLCALWPFCFMSRARFLPFTP